MTQIMISIDLDAHALYAAFSTEAVATTVDLGEGLLVDLDRFGVVAGVEVIGLDTAIPVDRLEKEYHVRSEHVDVLRGLSRWMPFQTLTSAPEGTSDTDVLAGDLASSPR